MNVLQRATRGAAGFALNVLGKGYGWIYSALRIASGGRVNWSDRAGQRIDNSAVWSVLTYIINGVTMDPRLIVQKRPNGAAKAAWVEDDSQKANQFIKAVTGMVGGFSATQLLSMVILSIGHSGTGYWYKVRSRGGDVVGFQPIRPDQVTLKRDKDFKGPQRWHEWHLADGSAPITYYEIRTGDGALVPVPVEDIVRFPYMVDLTEPALGVSPFGAALREIVLDNEAATLNFNLTVNGGFLGWAWSPSTAEGITYDPQKLAEIQKKIEGQVRDSGNAVMPVPGRFDLIGHSPDKLILDKTRSNAIARVLACFNIDPMAVGLPSDQKTYSNFEEADEQAMRKAVMPIMRLIADVLTEQVLRPDFGFQRGRVYWDTSEISALQPDLDKLHQRVRADFMADLIDRAEAREAVGRDSLPGDKGIYYSQIKGALTSSKTEKEPDAKAKTMSRLSSFRELERVGSDA